LHTGQPDRDLVGAVRDTEIYTELRSHDGYTIPQSQVAFMSRHELGAAFARANDKVTEDFGYVAECSARVRRLMTRYVSSTPTE